MMPVSPACLLVTVAVLFVPHPSLVDAGINVLLVPGPLAGSRLMLMNYIGTKLVARHHNVTVFINDASDVDRHERVDGAMSMKYDVVGDSHVQSILPLVTSLSIDWEQTASADNVDDLLRLESAWCRAALPFAEERWNTSASGVPAYDVAVVDGSHNLCVMGLLHMLGIPYIQFLSTTFGVSHPADPAMSSYVPAYGTTYTDAMTFTDRMYNFIMANVWGKYVRAHYYEAAQEVFDDHFSRTDIDLELVSKEASLFLLNTDYTLEYIRPLPPTLVMIGGFHCQSKPPLPEDLVPWFGDATDAGVVILNLGSVINLRTAPHHVMSTLLSAFTRLKPMRFLIIAKSGLHDDIGEDLPENVRLVHWMNLQAALGHVNTRLFMSHGGTSSMLEAVCHAVPVLGVPLYVDHLKNIIILRDKGMARVLTKNNLTADIITREIREIILKPEYKDAALRQAMLLRDQPLSAINRVLYWVEYVARHGGSDHLRCAALDLSVLQRYQLDVLAALLGAPAVCTLLMLALVWRCTGGPARGAPTRAVPARGAPNIPGGVGGSAVPRGDSNNGTKSTHTLTKRKKK